jgi:putative salt-induced outer membrane protein YdiY
VGIGCVSPPCIPAVVAVPRLPDSARRDRDLSSTTGGNVVHIRVQRLLAALACLCLVQQVPADEVILRNGDRLSGTVKTSRDGKLVLETAYAGTIEILLGEISRVRTDKPVKLVLDDETTLTGVLSPAVDDGGVVIAGERTVSLTRIAAVNPPQAPRVKVSGQFNGGFSRDRGNTDEDSYHIDFENITRWVDSRLTMKGDGDLEKTNNDKTKQQADLSIKHDYFFGDDDFIFDKRWYLWSGADLEHDKFADLTLRTTAGLGPGYQIIDTERTSLSVEGGPVYVWENFNGSENQQYAAGRWHLDFRHQLFADWKLIAFHNHELRWSVEDSDDYIFNSKTGVRVPISEHVQASLQFNFDRDNAPAAGAKKNDYETIITGGYTW